MFIISDFQDYYDSMAYAYGVDKSLTFTRKSTFTQTIDLNSIFSPSLKNVVNHFVQSYKRSGDKTYHRHLLITPNKIYRVLQQYKWGVDKDKVVDYSEYVIDYTPNNEIGKYLIKQYLTDLENNEEYIRKVLYDTVNLPYFMLTRNSGGILEAAIPILREVNFNTIMDANQCFQMVEMQFSKQQGNHDNKLITIKDSDRITQHGFDKQSFRHRK